MILKLYCISIIGLIFGWLPLWQGLNLRNTAAKLEHGFPNGDLRALNEASRSLALFLRIMGVLMMIWVAVMVLYVGFVVIALVIGLVASAGASMQ